MKTPICIISYNRSLYLNSLLHSLKDELDHFHIIVCDNGSTEANMKSVFDEWSSSVEFIKLPGGDWINDEYKAKNALIRRIAQLGKTADSLFLQDDLQYIGPRGGLKKIIDDLSMSGFLNISFTAVRKSTLKSTCANIKSESVWPIKDNHYYTTGLFKNEVFDRLGFYRDNFPTQKEFWGRGEDDYHSRVIQHYGFDKKISAIAHVPIFIGIWNDPRGHYSFIRGGKRYGHYLPPSNNNKIYYDHLTVADLNKLNSNLSPNGFIDVAKPLGWSFAKDEFGDQKKYAQSLIMSEGPCEDIF